MSAHGPVNSSFLFSVKYFIQQDLFVVDLKKKQASNRNDENVDLHNYRWINLLNFNGILSENEFKCLIVTICFQSQLNERYWQMRNINSCKNNAYLMCFVNRAYVFFNCHYLKGNIPGKKGSTAVAERGVKII